MASTTLSHRIVYENFTVPSATLLAGGFDYAQPPEYTVIFLAGAFDTLLAGA